MIVILSIVGLLAVLFIAAKTNLSVKFNCQVKKPFATSKSITEP